VLNFNKNLIYFDPEFIKCFLKQEWIMKDLNKKRISLYQKRNWFNFSIKIVPNDLTYIICNCETADQKLEHNNSEKKKCDYCCVLSQKIFPYINTPLHIFDLKRIKCVVCNTGFNY